MRILVRRENPHPGAQLSLFEQHEGKRYQVTATSTPGGQAQFLEARHRTQARVEDRIRCAQSHRPGHLPSRNYQVNTAWCQAASIACDLLAWLRLLALDGDLATAEPKTLRYRILHAAGRIVKGQRRRLPEHPAIMALGTGHRRRVHPDPRPAPAMTRAVPPPATQEGTARPAVEPAPTRRDSRAAPHAGHRKTKIKNSSGRTSRRGRHTRESSRLTL